MVLDNLHETIGIVTATLVARGHASGDRDRTAELVQQRAGLVESDVEPALVPADQARRPGVARPAEVKLAHQQTRLAQRREMNPQAFLWRDQKRRMIARHVTHFQPAILEQPGEPLTVARQGKRGSTGSVRTEERFRARWLARPTENRVRVGRAWRPGRRRYPPPWIARTIVPPSSAGRPSTRGVSDRSRP